VKHIGLLGLMVLAACNTPPLGFAGTTPQSVTIGQSTFDVRIKGDRAHALRTNRAEIIGFIIAPRLVHSADNQRPQKPRTCGCRTVCANGDSILPTEPWHRVTRRMGCTRAL